MMIRAKLAPLARAAGAPCGASAAQAESGWTQLNMPRGVTEISRKIYDLHMEIFWVCVAIAVVVFGAMIWSIITYRKSRGAIPDVTLVHNTKVEFMWTVVPVIILIAMAVPAAKTLVKIEDTTKTDLSIKVTGFQWGWQYDYLDDGVAYYSRLDRKSDAARELGSGIDPNSVDHYLLNVDHPLVVPVGTKVRLLITGADVIHSWWVPAFGVKKDAIPGFVNEAWFKVDTDKPGLYRGQCAELCGRDHGFMPIVVDVRSKADFATCLKDKAARAPAAPAPGSAPNAAQRESPMAEQHSHAASHDHDHKPYGWRRWVYATNHKDIGTMYLILACTMFFIGGGMAMLIRLELFTPGLQFFDPQFFNSMTTMHALIMIFGAVMPAWTGLANWMCPMQFGAPDRALPRLNNFSFWILPFAFTLLLSSLFVPGGAPAGGWTMYPPLVLQTGASFPMLIFSIHLMGASSILGAINVIVTIVNMRAPGLALLRMPLFVWTWLITAYLLIAVMPVLAGAVTMLLTAHFFGTTFFTAAGGGDPVMFQHIFWFFGHPEVYILILPAFGIVSEVIPTFSGKPLFGYEAMVYAVASIAFLSFIVWAHHMFTVGMPLAAQLFFMLSTMLIAVPTGVKVFNWTATMWKGSLSFEPPMLFALAFLFLFTIGGFSGLMLAMVPADFQYQDTYFVVAHFHYVLVPGAIFGIMGGVYYWLPKWTGRMYDQTLATWHFWLSAIFVNVLFFPQHFLGLAGMPRRIPDYALQFPNWNMMSSIGAFGFGVSQLLFAIVIVQSIRGGKKATAEVWDGTHPTGLEWTLPSP